MLNCRTATCWHYYSWEQPVRTHPNNMFGWNRIGANFLQVCYNACVFTCVCIILQCLCTRVWWDDAGFVMFSCKPLRLVDTCNFCCDLRCDFLLLIDVNEWIRYVYSDEGTCTPNIHNSSARSHASERENRSMFPFLLNAQAPVNSVVSLVWKRSSFPSPRDFVKWNVLKSTQHRTLRKGKQTELRPPRKGQFENQRQVKRFVKF